MQRLSRLISGLLMALVLALTGPGTSISGMAAAGLTPMEICGSGDVHVVWLDAKGDPADPVLHCTECPFCTAQGPVALPVRPDPAALKGGHARRLAPSGRATPVLTRNRHTLAEARAPPLPARKTLDIPGTFEPVIGFESLEFGQVIPARSVAERGHPMKDACR